MTTVDAPERLLRPLATTAAPKAAAQWALAGLSLATLLSSLGTSIANVALPTFAKDFAAPFEQVQWIVLAYLLSMTTLIVSVGRLGDVIGRRRLFLGGIALFTIASLVCGSSPALWLLIAARAAQGVGAAVMTVLTLTFVSETVPKGKTGTAMGLLGTMSAAGTALGPSLGGVVIGALGWRAIFYLTLPLGVVAFLLAWRHLPADREAADANRTRFDVAGTLLLALTLAAYALAMTLGRGRNAALLVAVLIGIGLFVLVERNAEFPLIRLSMLRRAALSAGLAANTLVTTVVMATLVVGPFYLARTLVLDVASIGLVMACGPIVSALTGVPAGRLVDRLGTYRTTIAGLGAMTAGACTLALTPASAGVAGYIAPLVVITSGYALFQAANNTAVMSNLLPDQRGVVSGLLNLSRNLGLITGASAMGAVFAIGAATTNIATATPSAVASGMRTTFAFAAVLIMVALVITAAGRTREARGALVPISQGHGRESAD